MTDITITNASGVIFTFQDGDVDSVNSDIMSSVDTLPMPASAPADTIVFDLGGATKNITIRGQLHPATTTRTSTGTVTAILQQKQWLEALVGGAQSAKLFTSNYEIYTCDGSAGWNESPPAPATSTTKIVVRQITFSEETGNPNVLNYSLSMVVSSI